MGFLAMNAARIKVTMGPSSSESRNQLSPLRFLPWARPALVGAIPQVTVGVGEVTRLPPQKVWWAGFTTSATGVLRLQHHPGQPPPGGRQERGQPMRFHRATQAYLARRIAGGKSKGRSSGA